MAENFCFTHTALQKLHHQISFVAILYNKNKTKIRYLYQFTSMSDKYTRAQA